MRWPSSLLLCLLVLPACAGGELPTDDDDTPCATTGALDIAEASVDLGIHWGGNASPEVSVGTTVSAAPCGAFTATSADPWLAPSIAADGSGFVVAIDPASVVSGRSVGTVQVQDEVGVAAELEVRLAALVGGGTPRALVVGVDGVDGDVLPFANTPVLDLLKEGGTWTEQASTQLTGATSSGPGWSSVFTGVEVDKHGVTSNGGYENRDPAYPTFLLRLDEELGLDVAAAAQWAAIFLILEDDFLAASTGGDEPTVRDWTADQILNADHDLLFVHYDDVDHAGHAVGYDETEPEYVASIEQADADIGVLLDAILDRPTVADEEWLIVVTTDHGGTTGGSHGAMTSDCQIIPTFTAGPTVPRQQLDPGQGSHLDVHATVIDHFGLDPASFPLDGGVFGTLRELDCGDGLDDDGDGDIDCEDAECEGAEGCWSCSADMDLTSEIGEVATFTPTEDRMEGSCGGGDGGESIVTWTAPTAGTWVFDTMNWYRDTVLYLREGVCTGAELACNDSPSGTARSVVTAELTQGQQLAIVVDTDGASSEGTGLSIRPVSATCPDGALTAGAGASTTAFTHNETAWAGTCPPVIADRWYSWTAPSDGDWTFDTTGSDFDTVLYVLDACGGTELGCNDDDGGLQSAVTVTLAQGDEIVVGAGSFAGRAASGTLVINATAQ